MTDTFEFTLNNPLTEEQWDMIADVDMEHTNNITFHTKHGKEVEFAKVIRCKSCTKNGTVYCAMADVSRNGEVISWNEPDDHCSRAEMEITALTAERGW